MQANFLIAQLAGTQGAGSGGNAAARPGGAAALLDGATVEQRQAFAPIIAKMLAPGTQLPPATDIGGMVSAEPLPQLQEKLAAQLAWLISDAAAAPTVTVPMAGEGNDAQNIGAESPLQANPQAIICEIGPEAHVIVSPGTVTEAPGVVSPGAIAEPLEEPQLVEPGTISDEAAIMAALPAAAPMVAEQMVEDEASVAEPAVVAATAAAVQSVSTQPSSIAVAMLAAMQAGGKPVAIGTGASVITGQPTIAARKPVEQVAPMQPVQGATTEEIPAELPELNPAEELKRSVQPARFDQEIAKPLPAFTAEDGLPSAFGLADRSGFSLKQAGPLAALQQKPVFAKSPMEQVRLQLSPALERGQREITIQMRPNDLGRVDVQLKPQQDGSTQVTVRADRPETLDMLQRDVRHLERTLQDSGLKPDSIQFQLRGGGTDTQAGSQQHQHQNPNQQGGQQGMSANADSGQGGQPQDGPYHGSPYLPAQELAADLAEIPASLLHSGLMASLSSNYQPHYEMRLDLHA